MSQENVDALRAVYDEWGKGSFGAGGNLWDPRVVFIPVADLPESGEYHGPEGINEFMRGFLDAWTEVTIAAEEFIEADGSVVVTTRMHGVGRGSGIAGEARTETHVWTFRGRAVIRFEAFVDRAAALEAVGLAE